MRAGGRSGDRDGPGLAGGNCNDKKKTQKIQKSSFLHGPCHTVDADTGQGRMRSKKQTLICKFNTLDLHIVAMAATSHPADAHVLQQNTMHFNLKRQKNTRNARGYKGFPHAVAVAPICRTHPTISTTGENENPNDPHPHRHCVCAQKGENGDKPPCRRFGT